VPIRSRSGRQKSYRAPDPSWISAYAPRYDVTLSLVSLLGAGGVQQMHEPAMTTDERAALERSVAALREAARRVLAAGS
jgi:L-lactate dehydrogenase